MKQRSVLAGALALLALGFAQPATAQAVERINAAFLAEYGAEDYVIDQGEIVTFTNRDRFLAHGLASDAGTLFGAPVLRRGQTRLVRGAPFLSAGGPYPFHCPIHAGMTSRLHVTPAGAPLPPDAIRPGAKLKLRPGGLRRLLAKRRVRVVVIAGEALDAVVKASAGGVALGRVERTYVAPGRRAVTLSFSAAAAAAVRRAPAPVKLSVRAALSDAAGNRGGARARRVLGGAG